MKIKINIVFVSTVVVFISLILTAQINKYFFIDSAETNSVLTYQISPNEIIDLVKSDPNKAFTELRNSLKENPSLYPSCHALTHRMGHAAFDVHGYDMAMQYQNPICGGGYIHGLLERKFGLLTIENIQENMLDICKDDPICLHGVGHGLMIATKDDIQKSLSICKIIKSVKRTNCFDGVFMHSFDNEDTGIIHNSLDVKKASDVCKNSPSYAKGNCYFYLPRTIKNEDASVVSNFCSNINDDNFQRFCFTGVGALFMKYNPIFNRDDVLKKCDNILDDKNRGYCYSGVERYKKFNEINGLD